MDSSSKVPDTVQSVADADPESSMADGCDDESTMAEVVQAKLVENLSTFLEKERGLAMFACGGVIPIKHQDTAESSGGDKPTDEKKPAKDDNKPSKQEKSAPVEFPTAECVSPPVTIRWDAPDGKVPSGNTKLNFPLDGVTAHNLPHLLSAAAPASFGRGGENVLDETYRKALKLDTTKFSSTFNPYELGIIDTIAQLLLPSTIDSRAYRSVRAELYKLNIYSSPSGKFLPHVDTPRSPNQFGSLVVCLPLAHEGGQLIVRHKGRDFTFDFGTDVADADHASIRWAAFYSDCEHEVKEVTSGHRVTLTYNLYAVRGNGSLTGYCPSLDASHLPLYHGVEALLQDGRFMKDGGYLGLYCNHAYAYTSESGDLLPDTLKGLDMVVWETLTALGVKLSVKPVIAVDRYHEEKDKWYAARPDRRNKAAYKAWLARQPREDQSYGGVVGDKLALAFSHVFQVETSEEQMEMYREWEGRDAVRYDDVTWLNEPTHREMQLLYTAYGNEASIGCEYSHCAILARIPRFDSEVGHRKDDEQDSGSEDDEQDSGSEDDEQDSGSEDEDQDSGSEDDEQGSGSEDDGGGDDGSDGHGPEVAAYPPNVVSVANGDPEETQGNIMDDTV